MVAPLTDVPTTSVILPPAGGATLTGIQYLDATASDAVGVTKVEFHLSGGTFSNALIATAAPTIYGWLAGWDSSTVPDGTYSIQSVAYDAAGASSKSIPVTINVINGPTTAMLIPASRSMLTGTQVLDAAASDPLGVTSVAFLLTGGPFNQAVIGTGTSSIYGWLASWNTTAVPDGNYTLQSFATNSHGLSTYSAGISLTVFNPSVTTVSPASGTGAGGTKVVITGTNLVGATGVMFGAVNAASFTVDSKSKVTAYSPPEVAGPVNVTVIAPGTSSYVFAGDQFTFLPPAVTKVTPVGGPALGGTSVTVTGSNLAGATQVWFGTQPAKSFTVKSATKIVTIAPTGTPGTVPVTVTTFGGTSVNVPGDLYTYR